MDRINRSRGWDKEIPHCVLPMEQLVLSDKWARKIYVPSMHRSFYCFVLSVRYKISSLFPFDYFKCNFVPISSLKSKRYFYEHSFIC